MALIFFVCGHAGSAAGCQGIGAAWQRSLRVANAAQWHRALCSAIPACIGLIAVNDHFAAVLIGQEFRSEAVRIMPRIAVPDLLAGLQVHHFDHALGLGKRPTLLIESIGIAAIVNMALNILLLPRIRLMRAVYATIVSYVVAIMTSVYDGHQVLKIPFPFMDALRSALAGALMWAALERLNLPLTLGRLVGHGRRWGRHLRCSSNGSECLRGALKTMEPTDGKVGCMVEVPR